MHTHTMHMNIKTEIERLRQSRYVPARLCLFLHLRHLAGVHVFAECPSVPSLLLLAVAATAAAITVRFRTLHCRTLGGGLDAAWEAVRDRHTGAHGGWGLGVEKVEGLWAVASRTVQGYNDTE